MIDDVGTCEDEEAEDIEGDDDNGICDNVSEIADDGGNANGVDIIEGEVVVVDTVDESEE
jgi:hypothetical protein